MQFWGFHNKYDKKPSQKLCWEVKKRHACELSVCKMTICGLNPETSDSAAFAAERGCECALAAHPPTPFGFPIDNTWFLHGLHVSGLRVARNASCVETRFFRIVSKLWKIATDHQQHVTFKNLYHTITNTPITIPTFDHRPPPPAARFTITLIRTRCMLHSWLRFTNADWSTLYGLARFSFRLRIIRFKDFILKGLEYKDSSRTLPAPPRPQARGIVIS